MLLHIINYAVRIIIIIIGILLVSGVLTPKNDRTEMFTVMGVIFILFGLYRVVLYNMKSKEYDFSTKQKIEDIENEDDTK